MKMKKQLLKVEFISNPESESTKEKPAKITCEYANSGDYKSYKNLKTEISKQKYVN